MRLRSAPWGSAWRCVRPLGRLACLEGRGTNGFPERVVPLPWDQQFGGQAGAVPVLVHLPSNDPVYPMPHIGRAQRLESVSKPAVPPAFSSWRAEAWLGRGAPSGGCGQRCFSQGCWGQDKEEGRGAPGAQSPGLGGLPEVSP